MVAMIAASNSLLPFCNSSSSSSNRTGCSFSITRASIASLSPAVWSGFGTINSVISKSVVFPQITVGLVTWTYKVREKALNAWVCRFQGGKNRVSGLLQADIFAIISLYVVQELHTVNG